MISRRNFLKHTSLFASGAAGSAVAVSAINLSAKTQSDQYHYHLTVKAAKANIVGGHITDILSYNGHVFAPIIRAKQGVPVRIDVTNELDEPTTVHWHGLRIPVNMDGVPGTGQVPIAPGDTFTYYFTPPDAGTMWYHTHENSVDQMGRGLVGLMLVDEAEPLKNAENEVVEFDHDIPVMLKNWHLNKDGSYYKISMKRYAARQGTPGLIYTANGQTDFEYDVKAGQTVRLRMVNTSNTQMYRLNVDKPELFKHHPLKIDVLDANPLDYDLAFKDFALGAGMRIDILFVVPDSAGQTLTFLDQHKPMFKLNILANESEKRASSLPVIPKNPVIVGDLDKAEKIEIVLEWAAADDKNGDPLFWNLNTQQGFAPASCKTPNQIADFKLGNSYLVDIRNNTQYPHPIHFHGHTFKVLSYANKDIQPYLADTVMLEKNEAAQILIYADNPGMWMFHCHVIEHMAMGLVGLVKVS
ncbi:multicopper oxidase family protein [Marinicellulosiphila megalodicopiae]|uniref:multicopper oxidase family protein n=1 Tax=Marinicellulosiphila megalodicopiae TaxID=2724896 RepID=UPI003BB00681